MQEHAPVDREGKKVARVEVDVGLPAVRKEDDPSPQGRFGEFLSCSGYPECTGSLKLDRAGTSNRHRLRAGS